MKAALRLAPVALLLLMLAACGGGSKSAATTSSEATSTQATDTQAAQTDASGCTAVTPPAGGKRDEPKPTKALDPSKTYDVKLQTNCGSFTIRLAVKTSPATTASFVSLVQKHFFDGTIFHRIVPGFVVQGGDPTGTGGGGPGYQTVDKPPASTAYTLGVVAMAKTQTEAPGTSGSQFFVVTAQDAQLPPDYAVLGHISAGSAVVSRIGELGDQSTEQPTETVEIEHATLTVH
jgi:cyclophilin family peptidyl-prolyl cis-trans isomerase